MIIAIDGPAGAGKRTIASHLAARFNFFHFDTGLLYRALANQVFRQNISIENIDEIITAAKTITREDLQNQELSLEYVAEWASRVAEIPQVRKVLLTWQRDFVKVVLMHYSGVIVDGRDIATVVFPNAECKIFVTANEDVRLKRRLNRSPNEDMQKDILQKRDQRDANRKAAPLQQAKDAFLLDTSELNVEEILQEAEAIVKRCFNL